MTIEEAVALLQRHERARQGRLRAKLMMEIRRQETAEKMKGKTMQNVSEAMAANKIQCLWKGAIARRKVKKQREDELAFIGMVHYIYLRFAPRFDEQNFKKKITNFPKSFFLLTANRSQFWVCLQNILGV
jgi:hypothetical protein